MIQIDRVVVGLVMPLEDSDVPFSLTRSVEDDGLEQLDIDVIGTRTREEQ